jgi:branched-chain amino acid transport system permease protein
MKAVALDGIVLGLQFGLLGVGMTLIYGLGGVLNLAYGQAAVLAAMVVAITLTAGAPALVATAAGLLAAARARDDGWTTLRPADSPAL